MNKREIAEIKKINKFSSDGCTIDRMCVCYVDAEKNIILKDRDAFFSLPEDEIFKYWEILRKAKVIAVYPHFVHTRLSSPYPGRTGCEESFRWDDIVKWNKFLWEV